MENTYFFEAVTTYDKEAVTHYTIYHYRHVDRRGPAVYLLLGALFSALALWRFWWGETLLPVILAILGVGLLLAGVNFLTGKASIKVPEGENGRPPVNRQRFFGDRLEYAGAQAQGYYRYGQITRIGEDEKYFYIYVQSSQALIIQKSGMTLGAPDQLRRFLDEKAPGRRR